MFSMKAATGICQLSIQYRLCPDREPFVMLYMHDWIMQALLIGRLDLDIWSLSSYPLRSKSAMTQPLMWYVTLSKAWRSGRFGQAPQSLDSREYPDSGTEDDE